MNLTERILDRLLEKAAADRELPRGVVEQLKKLRLEGLPVDPETLLKLYEPGGGDAEH